VQRIFNWQNSRNSLTPE